MNCGDSLRGGDFGGDHGRRDDAGDRVEEGDLATGCAGSHVAVVVIEGRRRDTTQFGALIEEMNE